MGVLGGMLIVLLVTANAAVQAIVSVAALGMDEDEDDQRDGDGVGTR